MKEERDAIFQIAVALLIFWIASPMLMSLIGLEFTNDNFEANLEEIRFYGMPICILLTLFKTIKPTDKPRRIFFKVLLTIGLSICVCFFLIASIWGDLCGWTNEKTLYVNRQNEKIKIIKRSYGCGLLSSGSPIVKDFKVRELSSYFIIASEIDIKGIDETRWMKY